MIAIVMLDNARHGSGPGVVVETAEGSIGDILARYTDRDGARSERLRLWKAYPGCRVGDRVVVGVS